MRKNTTPLTSEQQKLVEDNHDLIFGFLNKYNLPKGEYYDLAAIALCLAARNYRPDSGFTFSTYAYTAMKNEINTEKLRRQKKSVIPENKLFYYQAGHSNEESEIFEELLISSVNIEDELLTNMFFADYLKQVNEKARKILELSLLGLSTADVAEQIPCSRQHVCVVKNKFKEALRKEALC